MNGDQASDDGKTVAVMFRKVEETVSPRNLHVNRELGFEGIFPVDVEAEKADVKRLGLLDIEDAEDGDGLKDVE